MKTQRILRTALVTIAFCGGIHQSYAMTSCFNCSAEVLIDSNQAQKFADTIMIIESMPLSGEITAIDYTSRTATVLVSTYPEYAQSNGLDSFDVAKRLLGFVGSEFQIKAIRAVMNVELKTIGLDSVGNVGTIGHR